MVINTLRTQSIRLFLLGNLTWNYSVLAEFGSVLIYQENIQQFRGCQVTVTNVILNCVSLLSLDWNKNARTFPFKVFWTFKNTNFSSAFNPCMVVCTHIGSSEHTHCTSRTPNSGAVGTHFLLWCLMSYCGLGALLKGTLVISPQ